MKAYEKIAKYCSSSPTDPGKNDFFSQEKVDLNLTNQ